MKKIIHIALIASMSFFLFGCSSKEMGVNFAKNYPTAPTWVFNQSYADSTYGYSSVGYAQKNPYNYELQLRQAEERAIFLLTSTLEARINKYVLQAFLHEGIGTKREIEEFSAKISKKAAIIGNRNIISRTKWFAPNGDVFVLFSVSSNDFLIFVDNEIEEECTQIRNRLAIKAETILLVKP